MKDVTYSFVVERFNNVVYIYVRVELKICDLSSKPIDTVDGISDPFQQQKENMSGIEYFTPNWNLFINYSYWVDELRWAFIPVQLENKIIYEYTYKIL